MKRLKILLSSMLVSLVTVAIPLTCLAKSEAVSDANNFQRGYALYSQGKYVEALGQFLSARRSDPTNISTRQILAEIYRKLHRYKDAETELKAALHLCPDDNKNSLNLAQLYLDGGRYHEGKALYQNVLSRSPSEPEALMGMAIALEGSGDLESAYDYYKQILSMPSATRFSDAARTRLARIRKARTAIRKNRFFPIDKDFGEAGLGWWDLRKMPITVYIDSGYDSPGYRPQMRKLVSHAIETWSNASNGEISFILLNESPGAESLWKKSHSDLLLRLARNLKDIPQDSVSCDIHVHWKQKLPNGLGFTWTSRLLGKSTNLTKAHIWISTGQLADGSLLAATSSSQEILEMQNVMLEEVITHEFGHALGLPHMANPNDLMAGGIFAFNAVNRSEARKLSHRDIKSLNEHYNNFQSKTSLIAKLEDETSNSPFGGYYKPMMGDSEDSEGSAGTQADSESVKQTDAPASESLSPAAAPDETKPEGGGSAVEKGEFAADLSVKDLDEPEEKEEDDETPVTSKPHDPIKDALFDYKLKRYKHALSTLDRIIDSNASNPQALYIRAMVYVMLRQYDRAVADYKEVTRLVPDSELGSRARSGMKKLRL